jgi:hypothetical protein
MFILNSGFLTLAVDLNTFGKQDATCRGTPRAVARPSSANAIQIEVSVKTESASISPPHLSRTRVTGTVANESYFHFEERQGFSPDEVIEVLNGKYLGVIYRNVVDPQIAASLLQGFWRSPAARRRPDAPSYFLGAYHFDKSVEDYLAESAAVNPSVESLVNTPDSPWVWFRTAVADRLRRDGVQLRVAEMATQKACLALIRSWDAEGEFALYPHEDMSQCQDPRQAGFEIQDVVNHEICAVNMCLANGSGGRLVIWNMRPDEATRERLQIRYTGFSYPPAELAGVSNLRVDIGAGDIYVFNGAYIHAVERTQGLRATISFFIGHLDERTVATWT